MIHALGTQVSGEYIDAHRKQIALKLEECDVLKDGFDVQNYGSVDYLDLAIASDDLSIVNDALVARGAGDEA